MSCRGFSLPEVLVSLLLLALLFSGYLTSYLHVLRLESNVDHAAIAISQLEHFIEQREAGLSDISVWNEENEKLLPGGEGQVSDEGVILHWGQGAEACNRLQVEDAGGCIRVQYPRDLP